MIRKKYLTEVSFQDGTTEFKSYRTYTKTFINKEVVSTLTVKLEGLEVDTESVEVSIKNRQDINVLFKQKNNELNTIILYIPNDSFITDDSIEINYIALNEATSDLYSVDYANGLIYLATASNIALEVESESYNLLATGKATDQLDKDEYVSTTNNCTINNYQTTSTYNIIYNTLDNNEANYTTPLITNVKVNYINTSEEESL